MSTAWKDSFTDAINAIFLGSRNEPWFKGVGFRQGEKDKIFVYVAGDCPVFDKKFRGFDLVIQREDTL